MAMTLKEFMEQHVTEACQFTNYTVLEAPDNKFHYISSCCGHDTMYAAIYCKETVYGLPEMKASEKRLMKEAGPGHKLHHLILRELLTVTVVEEEVARQS